MIHPKSGIGSFLKIDCHFFLEPVDLIFNISLSLQRIISPKLSNNQSLPYYYILI